MNINLLFLQELLLIGIETATPRGIALSFRPWTELAREAAKAMPPESVRRNGNQHFLVVYSLKLDKNDASYVFSYTDIQNIKLFYKCNKKHPCKCKGVPINTFSTIKTASKLSSFSAASATLRFSCTF